MQTATSAGLKPAAEGEGRVTIETILNANSILGASLRSMWESKTPDEAHDILAQADVTVTNQSDKDKQLPKRSFLRVSCTFPTQEPFLTQF